jgi:type IV pilus assembly protein PilE
MDKFMTSNTSRGFTLMEILIVVLIVGVLTAIAIPQYQNFVIRSRIMSAIQGLSERQYRMEQCYQDHQEEGYKACKSIGSGETGEFDFYVTKDDSETPEGDDPTRETFKLWAVGKGTMYTDTLRFEYYTVDQANNKTSKIYHVVKDRKREWHSDEVKCWITGTGGTTCQ